MELSGKSTSVQDELVKTYRPIVNGAGLAGIGYFLFNAAKRFFISDGLEMMVMGPLALIFAFTSAVMWHRTREIRTALQLEICCAIICSALLINTTVHMLIRFQQENLVYFGLMMPLFAILTHNLRMVGLWTSLCAASMLILVHWHMPDMLFEYISVVVACSLGAAGAVALVRGALLNAVTARTEALREREEALRVSAHDTLTGLPNRRSFFDAFNARREKLAATGRKFVLVLVDLDGFKPVNDVYGHGAGDELLRSVAKRLKATCPAGSMAARLGGDEFALLVDYPSRPGEERRLATRIVDAICLPYTLEAGVVRISGSAGVYVCERTDLEANEMIERADHALYRAKNDRRGAAVVFSDRHEADLVNVHHVDRALRKADLEEELSLVFQPQFDMDGRRVPGFEALARWNSPQLGAVPPDVFVAAAERTNQMGRVTRVLLGKALKALDRLPEDLGLAFNLSAHDLMSETSVRTLIDQVRLSGIDTSRLEFEITETAMLTDEDFAARALAELRATGVTIALDDFGTGYSNFAYLQRLQVTKMKIDKSFVQPLLGDPCASKILQTLISLSKSLDLVCVVEGIEDAEQMRQISQFGARYIQGYLLAKPMPEHEIPAFLESVPEWIESVGLDAVEDADLCEPNEIGERKAG